MISRRGLLAGAAATPFCAATLAWAQDPPTTVSGIDITASRIREPINPYSIEELLRPAPALSADMSADGSRIALLMDAGQGDARETQVLVFSADDPARGEARFTFGDTNANWIRWAGSSRILVGVSGSSPTNLMRRTRSFVHPADRRRELPYKRVMAVPLDGTGSVQLFQPSAGRNFRIPPEKFRKVLNLGEVVAIKGADEVLMAAFDREDLVTLWEGQGVPSGPVLPSQMAASSQPGFVANDAGVPLSTMTLYRVDLATGEPHPVIEGSERTVRWEAQNGEPVLRRDLQSDLTAEVWRVRKGGRGAWEPVRTVSRADPDIIFLAASDRPRSLWVLARQAGEARRSVRLWDIDADTLAAPISSRPGQEPARVLFDADGRFLLASYRSLDGLDHDTTDQMVGASLVALARHFGPGAAVSVHDIDASKTKLLLEVSGPRQPRAYYLFDSGRKRLADIGGGQRLLPERLADAEPVALSRPAGQALDGVLTGSLSGRPGPLVVVLQSGADPESLHAWDPLAQVFATRGWWTLRTLDTASPAEVQTLAQEAARIAGLDASRMVLFGQGAAARAAIERLSAGPWRAAVAYDSPESEEALLAGASLGRRRQLALEAAVGGKPVLVVRNWRDARVGRQDDRRTADALLQNDAGGLAAAADLGEAGDADWNKLATQVERVRIVADFVGEAIG